MPIKQLIFPCYCNHCRHLSFLTREGSSTKYQMLDFIRGAWKPHSCAQMHPETIEQLVGNSQLNEIGLDPEAIPFQYQGESTAKKRQPLSMGVVVNLDRTAESPVAGMITPENQLISVRILNPTKPITAGRALNLKKAVRVGRNKYRIEKTDFLPPGRKTTAKKSKTDPFYRILLNAQDQEKLETFVNRLITTCKNNRTLPINIIPLPIEKIDGEQIFKREIHLPLDTELLLKIEKITLPESIQISVRHD